MKTIVRVINEAIRKADAECLPCDRVNRDYDRHVEYRDSDEHRALTASGVAKADRVRITCGGAHAFKNFHHQVMKGKWRKKRWKNMRLFYWKKGKGSR